MVKHLSLFIFVFLLLPINIGKAEVVPHEIKEECKREVLKRKPFQVTYNWGELGLNLKTHEELSESCGGKAVGCFHGPGIRFDIVNRTESLPIGEYRCFYPVGVLNIDFSGSSIDLIKDHPSCFMRTTLRHELQHFMNWRSGYEQMLAEVRKTMLDNTLIICKRCDEYDYEVDLLKFFNKISNKWKKIISENDERLDEVDNHADSTIADRICEPPEFYSDLL